MLQTNDVGYPNVWIFSDIHEIGFGIGREENLSYHQARHSFGTFLINEGICTESIAKMMGHASLRSTTTYARLSDMKISADMDALVKRRKEEGLSKKEVANQPKGSCRTLKKRLKITICKEEPKNNDELQDNRQPPVHFIPLPMQR